MCECIYIRFGDTNTRCSHNICYHENLERGIYGNRKSRPPEVTYMRIQVSDSLYLRFTWQRILFSRSSCAQVSVYFRMMVKIYQ